MILEADRKDERQDEPGVRDRFDTFLHATTAFCHKATLNERWSPFELPAASRAKDFNISYASVLKAAQQMSLFVDINPEILGGAPRIKNTRVPLYGVLNAIEEYGDIGTAAKAYRLTAEAVKDALRFAANVLESPIEDDDPDSY